MLIGTFIEQRLWYLSRRKRRDSLSYREYFQRREMRMNPVRMVQTAIHVVSM